MTKIFCYGSLNLTEMFGITKETEVQEDLRPFLYHKDVGGVAGDIYLNITVKTKKEESQYGHTHALVASKKGVDGFKTLADLKEYIKPGTQPQPQYQTQPQYQPQYPSQGGYEGSGVGFGVDF